MFAPAVFPYVESDVFLIQSAYDSWQLTNILNLSCAVSFEDPRVECSAAEMEAIDTYGATMRESIAAAMGSTPHHEQSAGCFVSACITHEQDAAEELYNQRHAEWDLLVGGRMLREVVHEWFFGAQGVGTQLSRQAVEPCPHWPCNPDPRCSGFTRAIESARSEPPPT